MKRFSGLRDFLLIWSGQVVSSVGSRLSSFAMGLWILQTTGSSIQFAMTFVAMDVPGLLVAPLAGPLVDRWDRRRVMAACDAVCALAALVMAALLAGGQLAVWHVYAGVAVASVCATFHGPAFNASIPLLVDQERLPRINAMVQSGTAAAAIVSPLLAGAMVTVFSLGGVLLADALTFVVAVGTLLLARVPRVAPSTGPRRSVLAEAAVGWRYLRERPALMALLYFDGLTRFLFGMASVLIAPLVLGFATPALLGVQYSISGAGLLAGGLVMAALGAPRQRGRALLALSALAGLLLAAHGLRPAFAMVAAAGFLMFFTLPMIGALNTSIWQSKVPPELQGRCFSMKQVLSNTVSPLAYVLSGPLAELAFEPLLQPGGALAGSFGWLLGVGPGRGTGLAFVVLGLALAAAAALVYALGTLRQVDALPDARAGRDADEARPGTATGDGATAAPVA